MKTPPSFGVLSPKEGGVIRTLAQLVLFDQLEGDVEGLAGAVDGDGDGVAHPQAGQVDIGDLIGPCAIEVGDDITLRQPLGGGVGAGADGIDIDAVNLLLRRHRR